MGCHAKGAVPLIQGEEERCEMQRDKNTHPHGPVEGPHEGSNGSCSIPATDLLDQMQTQEADLRPLIAMHGLYKLLLMTPRQISLKKKNAHIVFIPCYLLFSQEKKSLFKMMNISSSNGVVLSDHIMRCRGKC